MGAQSEGKGDNKEAVIGKAADFFKSLGGIPSRREYGRLSGRPFSISTIERLFGWGEFRRLVDEKMGHPVTPPKFDKSDLVSPSLLTGDDYDRLAVMAGLKEVGLPKRFREMLANLVMTTEEALLKLPRYHLPERKTGLEATVLLLSDLHSGRRYYDDQGQAVYNQDILAFRMGLVKDYLCRIVDERIRLGRLDEFYIALIGDIIDGSGIFPGQELHQDLTCFVPQICLAVACIWDLAVEVRQLFNIPVHIKGVRGNHGRQYKFAVANNNFDNLVFQMLYMLALTYDPHGVSVEYSTGAPYLNFQVKGYKCHMRHEAPVQTETPAARAKFLGWRAMHDYHLMFYGHKHHPGGGTALDTDVYMNGCLMGIDDLAESLALYSRPSQTLVGVDPELGATYRYNLYADRAALGGEADYLFKKYPVLTTSFKG